MCLLRLLVSTVFLLYSRASWSNVAIGGGGYMTSFLQTKVENEYHLFVRTDVGGAYRFDQGTQRWQPLLDFLLVEQHNLYHCESIAVNGSTVYLALGNNWQPGKHSVNAFAVSYDLGQQWTILTMTNIGMAGNGVNRWGGERLAVAGGRLWFGSRWDGLFKSDDGGKTWDKVTSFPFQQQQQQDLAVGTTQQEQPVGGVSREAATGVLFTVVTNVGTLYSSLYGTGIFTSNDHGQSWKAVSGGPKEGLRAVWIEKEQVLLVNGVDGLWKYSLHTRTWLPLIKSTNSSAYSGCGLDVDPNNSCHILAAEHYSSFYNRLHMSQDCGKTFKLLPQKTTHKAVPWWPSNYWASAVSQLGFDRNDATGNTLLMSTWYGMWFGDLKTGTWETHEHGHEEVVTLVVLSTPPPGVELFSGTADVQGFRHTDLQSFPASEMEPGAQSCSGIDFCMAEPNHMVRITGSEPHDYGKWGCAHSSDNGEHWSVVKTLPSKTAIGGKIVMSATNPRKFVWAPTENDIWVTDDSGDSWTKAKGAAFGIGGDSSWEGGSFTRIVGDRVNGSLFYYITNHGVFGVSGDGGYTWVNTTTSLPPITWPFKPYITSSFTAEGHVCVCLGNKGIHCTFNAGHTFTKMNTIETCWVATFGKKHGDIFLLGTTSGGKDSKVWVSHTSGTSWVSPAAVRDLTAGDGPGVMAPSLHKDGRFFIGTGGRGIFVVDTDS